MLYCICYQSSVGKKMIYDLLNELDDREGVTPLEYEVLNCAR